MAKMWRLHIGERGLLVSFLLTTCHFTSWSLSFLSPVVVSLLGTQWKNNVCLGFSDIFCPQMGAAMTWASSVCLYPCRSIFIPARCTTMLNYYCSGIWSSKLSQSHAPFVVPTMLPTNHFTCVQRHPLLWAWGCEKHNLSASLCP